MSDELLIQAGAFADAVSAAGDLTGPVPTCPDWSVRDLARHLGRVHRRVTATITSGAARMLPGDVELPDGEPPESPAEVVGWVRDGAAGLAETIAAAGPDHEVGGFTGPTTVAWWERRQVHETLVHRLDAELAAGIAPLSGVSPELAADGVAEWYDLITAFRSGSERLRGTGGTVHLHATDEPSCEWFVRRDPDGVTITREHGKADAALRGPAAALLATVTCRRGLDDPGETLGAVEVLGDRAALADWLAVSALR